MKRFLITVAVAILAAALLAPIGSAAGKHKGKKTYTTKLKGANEIPGPGDPDGKGKATIRLSSKRDRVCFTIETKRIAPTSAGHIHVGDKQTAGPVFVEQEGPPRLRARHRRADRRDPGEPLELLRQRPQRGLPRRRAARATAPLRPLTDPVPAGPRLSLGPAPGA